jgi:A/G-specific adenine glycosylase
MARAVLYDFGGVIPRTFENLVSLPGIGKYTANALLSSAFRKNVPIVDINVRRLFSRLFWRMKTTAHMRLEGEIWELAGSLVPRGKAYKWNQALMDLGATICVARSPVCTKCPVARYCASKDFIKRNVQLPSNRKPTRHRIPNRIYRGRIVEALRQSQGRKRLDLDAVGKLIHPQYSTKDRPWLHSLVSGLEKDGVVVESRNGTRGQRRVSLA